MRIFGILTFLFWSVMPVLGTGAETTLYGPVQYDVKQRFGEENRFTGVFSVPQGLYVIRLQNGRTPLERPDFLRLSVNGSVVLQEGRYEHPVIATFARLSGETSYELVLRDARPTGIRRPRPAPKLSILSVLSSPVSGVEGSFGGQTYDAVIDHVKSILSITDPASRLEALAAANLRNGQAERAGAVRRLSERKNLTARDFLLRLYEDVFESSDVRAEAALAIAALGDEKSIPALLQGVLNPEGRIRIASASALASYPEEQTRQPLLATVERLDPLRKRAFMSALAEGGWKPVSALMDLASSPDAYTANSAVEILGGLRDARALPFLLRLLEEPGKADRRTVVLAIGQKKSPAAVDPLIALAADPGKRSGIEGELAEALAEIGDVRGAEAIAAMHKGTKDPLTLFRLQQAYKKLTGKTLK